MMAPSQHRSGPTQGRVGDLLPELVLPRLDGATLDLRSLRGRRVVLFFWGSW
jgi:peroxiredoxin